MKQDTIEVFINEYYGHRYWRWKPNMTETEFVAWWQNLTETDIIKYYFNIRSLVGTVEEVSVENVITDESGHGRMYGDPADFYPHYYCHFNDVDDSFIDIGDSRYRFRRTTRRDWKEQWIDWTLKNEREFGSSRREIITEGL